MCNRSRLAPCLLFACAALMARGPLLAAQEVRAQEARVDSLRMAIRRAEANERAFHDSVNLAMTRLDTLVVPPLRLLVTSDLRSRTSRVAAPVAAKLARRLGSEAAQLSKDWIVVKPARYSNTDTLTLSIRYEGNDRLVEQLWGSVHDSTLSDWIFRVSAELFERRMLGPSLLAWTGNRAASALDTVTTAHWASLRLDLVSASEAVVRRCYDGDIGACLTALELKPTKDPVAEWYDASGRRAYVERNDWAARQASREQSERCIAGDDASCIAVMRIMFRRSQPRPALYNRITLVQTAMALGGSGANGRLLNSTGQPSERLAAVARVPVDSVVRVWLDRTRSARIASDAMSLPIAVSSLAWILACGAMALRSSRWR